MAHIHGISLLVLFSCPSEIRAWTSMRACYLSRALDATNSPLNGCCRNHGRVGSHRHRRRCIGRTPDNSGGL